MLLPVPKSVGVKTNPLAPLLVSGMKCPHCKKRVIAPGFQCKWCTQTHCSACRLPECHACSAKKQEQVVLPDPVVAPKLERI